MENCSLEFFAILMPSFVFSPFPQEIRIKNEQCMTSTDSEKLACGWPRGSWSLCGVSAIGDFCHKVAAVLQNHSQP